MGATREQLIERLICYAADDYDAADSNQASFVEDCINDAIAEVCNEMCPWGLTESEQERYKTIALQRYASVISRIAQYHYDKQGKEGVTTFYEAGQTNSYEEGATPKSYLRAIIPVARIC